METFLQHVRAAAPQLGAVRVRGNGVGNLNETLFLDSDVGAVVLRRRRPGGEQAVAGYIGGVLEACGLARHGARVVLRTAPQEAAHIRLLARHGVAVSPPLAHGEDWLVYPYVGGTPLDRLVARGAPGLPTATAHALRSLAIQLERAHAAGIVLGDRWGGNEIIGPEGDVVLIDFDVGLVGRLDDLRPFDRAVAIVGALAALTQPGRVPGPETVASVLSALASDRQDASRVAAMLDGHRRYYRSGRHQATGLAKPSAWYAAFDPILAQAAGHD